MRSDQGQIRPRRICTSMLSGKPASIAAIWAEPKLATRRAEEPKPERKRKSEEKEKAEDPKPENLRNKDLLSPWRTREPLTLPKEASKNGK